jgi:TonB-linked SusC/RagA family outer membrane protein
MFSKYHTFIIQSCFLLLFFMAFSNYAQAQKKTIRGVVLDENSIAVPYATVSIKNSKVSVFSDDNGNFRIAAKKGDAIAVTAVGIETKSIVIENEGSNLVVKVVRNSKALNPVVVTAQGIKREARSLGYSTASINSADLNAAKPINAAQGLIGKISGVQIITGDNSVSPTIRIQFRGQRHINADNQALVVVDGMIVGAGFVASLNPDDIENVSIMKGANAAALYGSEATNGVMLITTKKGSKNSKPSVNFSTTVTMEKFSYFPKLQKQFSGYGGEQGTFSYGPAIDPFTGFPNYAPFENQQYGPEFDGNPANGYIGGPNANGAVFKTPFTGNDTRLKFFNTGITTQNDLSYSSGENGNTFFMGLQHVNVKGLVPKDQTKRITARVGGKKTYGAFAAEYNASYTSLNVDVTAGPVYNEVLNTPANVPLTSLKNWNDPNSFANLSDYFNAYNYNPYWGIDNFRDRFNSENFQAGINLNLKPTDWMNFSYRAGIQFTSAKQKTTKNNQVFTDYAKTDPWGAGNIPSLGNQPGSVADVLTSERSLQQDITAQFNKKFGDINVNFIAGNSIWERSYTFQSDNSSNLFIPGIFNVNYGTGIPAVDQGQFITRLVGVYGDLTLGYKNYLFLHGNIRRDWSSLLAKGNNSYNIYSGDVSFVFTDAIKSLNNNKFLSFGKIRASYGNTGQISLSPYSTVNSATVAYGYPYGSLASLALSGNFGNPAVRPEQTIENEAGIELGFWKNKVLLGATYYHQASSNQTFPISVSSASGYNSTTVNAGEIVLSGWEFDLKTSLISNTIKKLKWDAGINLSINNSRVKSLLNGVSNYGIGNYNAAITDQPFPVLFVQDLTRDPNGRVVVDGLTGYPSVDPNFKIAGRTTPKYILGLNTSVTYKDFTFQIVADYRAGNFFHLNNNLGLGLDFFGSSEHSTSNGRQNFIFPNSVTENSDGKFEPNTNVYTQNGGVGFWVFSPYRNAQTPYLFSAAAWKLRSAGITYNLSRLLHRVKYLQSSSITFLGTDLLMLRPSENSWTDPEFNNGNSNARGFSTDSQLPPTRKLSIILKISF